MDSSRWDGFDIPPASPPHSLISSFTDRSEPEDPSNKLLVLDSLFPVVKCLPGFTKQQSSDFYYVQGKIDQESLYDYTKCIGELTLGAELDSDSRLAMHVLVRIARLQDPNKPLFPSLHHLRITNSSKYLDFLDIFLPSALTTIELTAISDGDPYYSSVLSFFESAIDQAHVSTLIFGPGRIQDQILQMSSKYKHLRCLEFRSVGISVTDQLLQDLGSLQHLETLVLQDNGTSTYKPSPEISTNAIPTVRQQDLEREAAAYVPSPVSPASSRWTPGFFPESRVSYVTDGMTMERPRTPFPAISGYITPGPRGQQDLEPEDIPFPLSHPCRGLSPEPEIYAMDQVSPQYSLFVESLSPKPAVSHGNDATVVNTEVDGALLFPALRTFEVDGSFVEALVTKVSPSDLNVLSIDFTQLLELRTAKQFPPNRGPRKRKSKATPSPPPQPISAPDIVNLLRRSIQIWGNTLVSVSLTNNHIWTFSLPSDLLESLLLRPDMKYLEITGIDIDSTDIKLHRLEEVVYSKLEVLHLPVHSTAASIAFVELRYIAENCPHLKSLRCRLRSFGDIPISIPKSHGLEVLSVSNAEVQLDQQLLFKIARYLDSAFPNLKTIKTHDENGNNVEQWGLISELVKTVCQAVRRDERTRHGT